MSSRSTSSISKTTGSSERIAASNGRESRNSSLKIPTSVRSFVSVPWCS